MQRWDRLQERYLEEYRARGRSEATNQHVRRQLEDWGAGSSGAGRGSCWSASTANCMWTTSRRGPTSKPSQRCTACSPRCAVLETTLLGSKSGPVIRCAGCIASKWFAHQGSTARDWLFPHRGARGLRVGLSGQEARVCSTAQPCAPAIGIGDGIAIAGRRALATVAGSPEVIPRIESGPRADCSECHVEWPTHRGPFASSHTQYARAWLNQFVRTEIFFEFGC